MSTNRTTSVTSCFPLQRHYSELVMSCTSLVTSRAWEGAVNPLFIWPKSTLAKYYVTSSLTCPEIRLAEAQLSSSILTIKRHFSTLIALADISQTPAVIWMCIFMHFVRPNSHATSKGHLKDRWQKENHAYTLHPQVKCRKQASFALQGPSSMHQLSPCKQIDRLTREEQKIL